VNSEVKSNHTEENVDPALLKVIGSRGKDQDKEYVKKLANAVLQTFYRHGVAKLRCVGAAAVNNADKAIAIAADEAMKTNKLELVEKKHFTTVSFKDDNGNWVEKTGLVKEVIER
jgi:stage V sporulation protein SpoVS